MDGTNDAKRPTVRFEVFNWPKKTGENRRKKSEADLEKSEVHLTIGK